MTNADFQKMMSQFYIKNDMYDLQAIEMQIRHTIFGMVEHNEGM